MHDNSAAFCKTNPEKFPRNLFATYRRAKSGLFPIVIAEESVDRPQPADKRGSNCKGDNERDDHTSKSPRFFCSAMNSGTVISHS